MKKAIATFSIIISVFVLGIMFTPVAPVEAGWDISIGFGFDSGYSDYGYDDYGYDDYDYYGYDDYGYGYDDYYDYNDYAGYDNYGYDNYNYGYNDQSYGGYNGYTTIYPRQGIYNPVHSNQGYNSYMYSQPVCMTRC